MKIKYYLYSVTFPNKKKYIGITSNFEKRKRDHLYEANNGRGFAFHYAIRKYGSENIKWEIVYTSYNKEEICHKEKEYIQKYNTYGSGGYNRTLGGDIGGKWNYDLVVEALLKLNVKTRSEWEEKSPNSYEYAFKNGIQKDIAQELGIKYKIVYWDSYKILKEIREKDIKSRTDWFKKSQNSYAYARKHCLIGKIAKKTKMEWKKFMVN